MSSPDLSPLTYFFMLAGPTGAAIVSAILAYVFSIRYQNHRRKIEVQHRVFQTLMAHRASGFQPADLVASLNLVPVVFLKEGRIIERWNNFYNLTSQRDMNEILTHYAYLDLLSEIANTLGYSLTQTDIAKHYGPRAYFAPLELEHNIREQLLRVLMETGHVLTEKRAIERIES